MQIFRDYKRIGADHKLTPTYITLFSIYDKIIKSLGLFCAECVKEETLYCQAPDLTLHFPGFCDS